MSGASALPADLQSEEGCCAKQTQWKFTPGRVLLVYSLAAAGYFIAVWLTTADPTGAGVLAGICLAAGVATACLSRKGVESMTIREFWKDLALSVLAALPVFLYAMFFYIIS